MKPTPRNAKWKPVTMLGYISPISGKMDVCYQEPVKMRSKRSDPWTTIPTFPVLVIPLTAESIRSADNAAWEAIYHNPDCDSIGAARASRIARTVLAALGITSPAGGRRRGRK